MLWGGFPCIFIDLTFSLGNTKKSSSRVSLTPCPRVLPGRVFAILLNCKTPRARLSLEQDRAPPTSHVSGRFFCDSRGRVIRLLVRQDTRRLVLFYRLVLGRGCSFRHFEWCLSYSFTSLHLFIIRLDFLRLMRRSVPSVTSEGVIYKNKRFLWLRG